MDICKMIHPSFDTLSDKEKNEFGKNVIKKWNNERDNWMRCDKKIKEYNKSGSAAKPVQKYKFYEQMQFLNKIVGHRPTETNMPHAEDVEENPITSESPVPKKKMKKHLTEKDQLERRITRLVDSVEKDDQSRIMSFFSGIAPTIEKFNDADIVEFQYEVIKAMRNITQKTQTPYLQHGVPRNYYQNLSQPAQFHLSHPANVAPNINEDPRGIYRNYNVNESNKVHQYKTPNGKRSFSSTAEPSPESIRLLNLRQNQST
ncbi:Hypothetical protein CINCED_3A017035, partial [Cinara cedri]